MYCDKNMRGEFRIHFRVCKQWNLEANRVERLRSLKDIVVIDPYRPWYSSKQMELLNRFCEHVREQPEQQVMVMVL